jgi:hypothetical protein
VLVKKLAHGCRGLLVGAEIQRALPTGGAIAERKVRSAALAAPAPPRGDDGALATELVGTLGQQPAHGG